MVRQPQLGHMNVRGGKGLGIITPLRLSTTSHGKNLCSLHHVVLDTACNRNSVMGLEHEPNHSGAISLDKVLSVELFP